MPAPPVAWTALARTISIASIGVAVFSVCGLPLPWLLGPMFACLAAALAGQDLRGPGIAGTALRAVLGLAAGASITPALAGQLGGMAASIALLPVFVLTCGLIGYPYFRRLWGFDAPTSYYAAMPGGLQDMLVFGEEAGGSPRILSLIHVTRVLVIVSGLPALMIWVMGSSLDRPPGAPAASIPVMELLLMTVIAVTGWRGAKAVGLFGASVLGPMFLAAVASLGGALHHRPPVEAILAAQFVIGLGVGARYVGITVRELRDVVLAGLGYVVVLAGITLLFTELVVLSGAGSPLNAILAFAPGGQAEMIVLALIVGADVGFVVTHQVIRMAIVITGAPLMRLWLK